MRHMTLKYQISHSNIVATVLQKYAVKSITTFPTSMEIYCFLTPFLSLFRHLFYNKRDIISEMLYSIRERGTQKVIIYLAGLSSDYAILY